MSESLARTSSLLVLLSLSLVSCSSTSVASSPLPVSTPQPAPSTPPATQEASQERIVAVGDLHGDLAQTLTLLGLAGLIDDQQRWIGGAATLVQTGDIMDRGDNARAILDLLQRLQIEAPKSGGKVIVLLGNHEVMNLREDLISVSSKDTEAFGGSDQRKLLLGPTGEYGKWLRSLDLSVKVGESVFVHGGISPELAGLGVDTLNRDGRQELASGTVGTILGRTGPTWYREYFKASEAEACPKVEKALAALGARRMIMGHTTQDGKVTARCEGRILGIDVGISAYAGSNKALLEIQAGDARALTPQGIVDLPDPR